LMSVLYAVFYIIISQVFGSFYRSLEKKKR
jgi:hypothetical protein